MGYTACMEEDTCYKPIGAHMNSSACEIQALLSEHKVLTVSGFIPVQYNDIVL